MRLLRVISMLLGLWGWGMGLAAFPLLYDCQYRTTADHTVCRYELQNLPAGAEIELSVADSTGATTVLTRKTVAQAVTAAQADSLVVSSTFAPERAILTVLVEGVRYGEMIHVPEGRYVVKTTGNRTEEYHVFGYFIGKREVSNAQFAQFIGDDGYDTQDYWIVEKGILKDPKLGWTYMGKRQAACPVGWNLTADPMYRTAPFPHPQAPVTGVTWFEGYAFGKWIGASLPTVQQLLVAQTVAVAVHSNTERRQDSLLMADNTSEWTLLGVDPETEPGAVGSEVVMLRKSATGYLPVYEDPLFQHAYLGFRIVVPETK